VVIYFPFHASIYSYLVDLNAAKGHFLQYCGAESLSQEVHRFLLGKCLRATRGTGRTMQSMQSPDHPMGRALKDFFSYAIVAMCQDPNMAVTKEVK
jgi:hypothetical protein